MVSTPGDTIFIVIGVSGTAAHYPRRRLGAQTQSEAGSSGHQAVIGTTNLVEALMRALKVTRVHSRLRLRLPMLQRYSCTERTVTETHNKQAIGTSTTSLLGSATYFTYFL